MLSESKFCLRRSRRCLRALLFVTSNVAKIKLAWNPITKVTPNILDMMFTPIVREIEVFRFENGIVLTMIVGASAGVGCERREKRRKKSEPIMKRTIRPTHVMWKYIIRWDFEPLTAMSLAKNGIGGFPETDGYMQLYGQT